MTSAKGSAASLRFWASARRMKTKWVLAVLYGLVVVLPIVRGCNAGWNARTAKFAFSLLVLAVLIHAVFVAWARGRKEVSVDVTGENLRVNDGARGVFSLHRSTLGEWYRPKIGTTQGIALQVDDGRRRFVLGGKDHRTDTGLLLEAPPVSSVDAWIVASDFDKLVGVLGHRGGLVAEAAGVTGPIRCLLFKISTFDRTVAGLLGRCPQPKFAMELDSEVIRVIEPKTGSLLGWGPLSAVKAARGKYTFNTRSSRVTRPLMKVRVPGLHPMRIAPLEGWLHMWTDEVEKMLRPEFVVSNADWLALLAKLGLKNPPG